MKFNFSEISEACVKCGRCIQVCTIYSVKRDEITSPRGYLDLVGAYSRGELKLDKITTDAIQSCFLCTNCVDVCPKNLRVDTAIEFIRSEVAKKHGISWYKRLFFFLLRHRLIMDIAAKLGYVFQSCGFKIQHNGMKARFNLPMIKTSRLLPSAAKRSFLRSHADIIGSSKRKIGLFIGCMGNYAYTNIGESIIKIAKALDIELNLMKKQVCCGAPAYFTGDLKTSIFLAKKNIEYFEKILLDVEAIIIPEATCSAMIRIDYEHLFEVGSDWHKRAIAIKDKVYMATEFFQKKTNLSEILSKLGKSDLDITYHDPCHARKMQTIWKEPRDLLLKNYTIKEMSDSNSCCGFGGIGIQSERYGLAQEVGRKKALMIGRANSRIVSAECSACRMQISASLDMHNINVDFKNPLELIAQML